MTRRAGKRDGGAACPVCGRPASASDTPFCSRRCADIDLHRWLRESYRIPTDETPTDVESGGEGGLDGAI